MKNNPKTFSAKHLYMQLFFISIALLLSTIVFAIPNSLTLQGKLTNLAGMTKVVLL